MFSRNDWAGMDADQRLLSLQGLETQEAAEQGRPATTVHPYDYDDPPGYETSGHYTPDSNDIYINREHINSDQPDRAVETWGHETKHANDHYNGEDLSEIPDPELDFQAYWEHPQEVGCRNYGEQQLQQYNQNEAMHDTGLYGNQNNTSAESPEQSASPEQNTAQSRETVPEQTPESAKEQAASEGAGQAADSSPNIDGGVDYYSGYGY